MATKASTQGANPKAPPAHPRSGGRWIRAADGSLSRAAEDEEHAGPDEAAPASKETR